MILILNILIPPKKFTNINFKNLRYFSKMNDIEMLINKIMDTVEQERGVRLVPEVKIVGKKVAELE